MLTMLFLLPMAFLIWASIRRLPMTYRRIPAWTGWLLLLPGAIGLVCVFVKMTYLNALIVFLGALTSYYIFRGAGFLGLLVSYSAYAKARPLERSNLTTLLGYFVTFVEPILMLTLFVLAFLIDLPAKLDVSGFTEIMFYSDSIITAGAVLSILFLIPIYRLRKQIAVDAGVGDRSGLGRPATKQFNNARPDPIAKKPLSGKAPWKGAPNSTPKQENLPEHYLKNDSATPSAHVEPLQGWPSDTSRPSDE